MTDQVILVTSAADFIGFASPIMADRPIRLFQSWQNASRLHLLITRVVSKLINRVPADHPAAANAPSKVYNVGNHHPEELTHVVRLLEQELGRTAIKELLPGDLWKRSRMSRI
jgi:UDP-glucuronate 4-epimerase